MKWKAACCVFLLACLMLPAGHGVAGSGATAVTGSVPLVAYEVSVPRVGRSTASISWKTNGDATSQVFYDTVSHNNTDDYAYYTGERKALVEEHKVSLNKLSPSTTHYYRVRSAAGGTQFVSDEYSFTTSPSPKGWKGWLANLFLGFTFPLYLSWFW